MSCTAKVAHVNWSARAWRGSNRWRKKYWRIRVLIICIIFSPTIVEFVTHDYLIVGLVRIACDAILATSEPRVVTHSIRYHKAEEVKRLQRLLWKELDSNRNHLLDSAEATRAHAISFDLEQLNKKVVEADLDQLAQAAVHLKLVSGRYSAKRIRQQAWHMAMGESEAMLEPQHKKIDSLLQTSYAWPNYKRWEIWERGISLFVSRILHLIHNLGSPITTGAWLLICFFVALSLAVLLPRGQPISGLFIGMLLAVGVVLLLHKPNEISSYSRFSELRYWLCGIGVVCLSAVVGNLGGRIATSCKGRLPVTFTAVVLIGIVLAIWGSLATPVSNTWFWVRGYPFGISALSPIKYVSIAVGLRKLRRRS